MALEKRPAFVSWSGGKDSCLALHRARSSGLRVVALLNVIDEEGRRTRSHGLPPAFVGSQARSLGCELVQPRASWDEYEDEFKRACGELARRGVTDAVFGAIGVDEHREWVERVSRECGLTPRLPLWDEPPRGLLEEFLALGFRAIIVSVDLARLEGSFLGRELDRRTLDGLLGSGVDPAGENGEYHTAVLSGPGFSFPLEIEDARTRPQPPGHACLDITDWKEGA